MAMEALHSRVSVECNSNGGNRQSCTEIIIVRHGQTAWNCVDRMQGQSDIDLNELGRQQAAAVADALSREDNISAVYSSDLKRAFDTAKSIATRCGGIQVITDQDLRERHIGVLQGQIFDPPTLMKLFPHAFQALMSDNEQVPGGGESRDQVYERGTSAVQRIGDKHKGERVVVVSHGALIAKLYERACPGGGGDAGNILNASIGIFHLGEGGVWSLKSWNDVRHLKQTGFGGTEASA